MSEKRGEMMRKALWLCFVALIWLTASCGEETPRPAPLPIQAHAILAEISPERSFILCRDTLTVGVGRKTAGRFFFFLSEALEVDTIEEAGRSIPSRPAANSTIDEYLENVDEDDRELYSNAAVVVLELPSGGKDVPESGPRRLVVSYSGSIYDSLRVPDYSRGSEAEQTTGLIDSAGTFLGPATHWYPNVPDSMTTFSVATITPEGYESVTQGRLVSRVAERGSVKAFWKGSHLSEGAYLVAGPYRINTLEESGVEIATYFYEGESDLSSQYLEASARYVSMYNELLGPYPYSKFAVVENFFPTGYGMPSYTVLGRRVLRLPFIVHTSLGHEIAHNWWGNGVLVHPDGGNWCEGLTTYCADYRYKYMKSADEAREYRRDINRDFTVYVTQDNDVPLASFTGRTTRASRAIGYGKSAMVFHMLEQMMGEEKFNETLRTIASKYMFKPMGWEDINVEFSKAAGTDLEWFFTQWVRGKGAPLFRIADADAVRRGNRYPLTVTIEQEGGPFGQGGEAFRVSLPVVIKNKAGYVKRTVEMDGPTATLRVRCLGRPIWVKVDPDHHVMRRMAPEEIAPTLAVVLGDSETLIVRPGSSSNEAAGAYEALARQLSRSGEARVVGDSELSNELLSSHSLFILGGAGENDALRLLEGAWPEGVSFSQGAFTVQGNTFSSPEDCVLLVARNPLNAEKAVAIFAGLSEDAISACASKIIHYGKYGFVVFSGGQSVEKGLWPVLDYPYRTITTRTSSTRI